MEVPGPSLEIKQRSLHTYLHYSDFVDFYENVILKYLLRFTLL